MKMQDSDGRDEPYELDDDEIFYIQARRCKRCGGLLTSRRSVETGYGCTCKRLARAEEKARLMQLSFFDDCYSGSYDSRAD